MMQRVTHSLTHSLIIVIFIVIELLAVILIRGFTFHNLHVLASTLLSHSRLLLNGYLRHHWLLAA